MQTVEFKFHLGDKVSFNPKPAIVGDANIGIINSLCLGRDGLQMFDVQYFGTPGSTNNGETHFAWFREDELRPA